MAMLSILLVLIACVIGAFGAVYLKKGAPGFSLNPLKLMRNSHLAAGVALYGVSTVFYMTALRFGELSVLYPMVSVTYILVSMLSARMLGETMNAWRWLGVVTIVFGVILIGISG